jgi:hypothetical protein
MAAWSLMLEPIGYFETSETANLCRVTSQKSEILTPQQKPEISGCGLFLTRNGGEYAEKLGPNFEFIDAKIFNCGLRHENILISVLRL